MFVLFHIISIHALLAESDEWGANRVALHWCISIHALLAESDVKIRGSVRPDEEFLSTLSLRRATSGTSKTPHFTSYFYPRSPCGERRKYILTHATSRAFLSTLSLRRATPSIGTLRNTHKNFYPRSPCGERHDLEPSSTRKLTFLSTLSLRRATADVPPDVPE